MSLEDLGNLPVPETSPFSSNGHISSAFFKASTPDPQSRRRGADLAWCFFVDFQIQLHLRSWFWDTNSLGISRSAEFPRC
ncbi:hypothetical protein CEP53_012259 [Fusarium sp. AF-6]|nr:hypothetical protein CEP53_012259 [Fusarium sp. AF-6]